MESRIFLCWDVAYYKLSFDGTVCHHENKEVTPSKNKRHCLYDFDMSFADSVEAKYAAKKLPIPDKRKYSIQELSPKKRTYTSDLRNCRIEN